MFRHDVFVTVIENHHQLSIEFTENFLNFNVDFLEAVGRSIRLH